jgi:hypothetical protein
MRRVAVIGPDPPCGALSGARFVELLSGRLGWEAFSLHPMPGLVLATSTQFPMSAQLTDPGYRYAAARVEADMLIWLRFTPRAYWRDWVAGWLDLLVNGAQGAHRRAHRARLADVGRAWVAMLQKGAVELRRIERLRPQLHFVELSSPEQALFWLKMQEERARETEPPRP